MQELDNISIIMAWCCQADVRAELELYLLNWIAISGHFDYGGSQVDRQTRPSDRVSTRSKETPMQKNTMCVHSGTRKDKASRGLNTPIHPSSSFEYLDAPENIYPRYYNTPNQKAVTDKLCALEGGEDALLFSSGMAAISSVLLAFLSSGDHAVIQRDIYGGTHHFITADFGRFRVEHSFVSNRSEDIAAAVRPNTKLIYIESPSNPLLRITDIAAAAQIGRDRNIVTAIDNTFASPVNQNPLAMGIDVVVHSGTKYLGGHSDLCCGVAVGKAAPLRRIRQVAVNLGGSLNALTCYLLERSLKTLSVRVERQNANAMTIAEFLARHPAVRRVNYPGLETHPGYAIARKQMWGFGGMLSFEVSGTTLSADQFLRRLKLITPALSLGGVETIICAPAGITDGLLRLSVGIEDSDDIIADLAQALAH
jgi:cystathionine beta-lyase/cystathionine gamma-synthase